MVYLQKSLSWMQGFALFFLTPTTIFAQSPHSLGLLEVRNQFPLALPYLNITPDVPHTLPEGVYEFSYQMAIANSFIMTGRDESKKLSASDLRSGLVETDFYIEEIQQPHNGFNLYIDVETYRQLFRLSLGLPFKVEVGIEWPLMNYGGGFMDRPIERVHDWTGVDNSSPDGGQRTEAPRDRFDYYLIRNNRFIFQERRPFDFQWGDPVIDVKWHLHQETSMLPHFSVKMAYKYPWDSAKHYPRNIISSGHADYGVYYLFSKSFFRNRWIAYLQGGRTILGGTGRDFKEFLEHMLLSAEYRASPHRSWLAQLAHQSSIFPTSSPPLAGTYRERSVDQGLGQPTDVLILGVKQWIAPLVYFLGFAEDVTQINSEIDFLLFFGAEWRFEE